MLKLAKHNNLPYVLICEDDVKFNDVKKFSRQLEEVVNDEQLKEEWKVILCSGKNNKNRSVSLGKNCCRVGDFKTTGCYMVKSSFYDDLLHCYKEGLKKLKHSKNLKEDNPFSDQEFNFSEYSIGNYWRKLQQDYVFLLLTPIHVVQKI
jgi:GR25 family glycosyltransferase involved in LPS biosynthesis